MTTRERRRQARALWQKACATWACGRQKVTELPSNDCQFMAKGDRFELWSVEDQLQASWSNDVAHAIVASALLDGLDVDLLTEVGG